MRTHTSYFSFLVVLTKCKHSKEYYGETFFSGIGKIREQRRINVNKFTYTCTVSCTVIVSHSLSTNKCTRDIKRKERHIYKTRVISKYALDFVKRSNHSVCHQNRYEHLCTCRCVEALFWLPAVKINIVI